MRQYLNYKPNKGPMETIEELDSVDFPTMGEYREACRVLITEYRMAFNSGSVYWSRRACKDWREKNG